MAYAHQNSNHFGGTLGDPTSSPKQVISSLLKAVLATALFRCWHILLFFTAWATAVSVISAKVHSLAIQPTLLTVIGTVLGFVISYRTTSSFERYNEGRRYWSQIILASRTLARAIWFHVPDLPPPAKGDEERTEEERKARMLVEKKTMINLVEAFSVAVKHYLRGEEGINYVDLYHLVKFLPSYAFPAGMIPPERTFSRASITSATAANSPEISALNLRRTQSHPEKKSSSDSDGDDDLKEKEGPAITFTTATPTAMRSTSSLPLPQSDSGKMNGNDNGNSDGPHVTLELPPPATAKGARKSKPYALQKTGGRSRPSIASSPSSRSVFSRTSNVSHSARTPTKASYGFSADEPVVLMPAAIPPKYSLFDLFPFSLLIKLLARSGKEVEGKKAAKLRAKTFVTTRNVPLEISMYLTSYVSSLSGTRKQIDVSTTNLMINTITQLVDALTGLERILTTPVPFSYSAHLWIVTIIYCLALPFQIWSALKWLTIPGTAIASFAFFGFLVAGEEIENPFGYDKNDLNMDHFTHNIIRNELLALTAFPPPDPTEWVFSSRNNCLFIDMNQIDETGEPRDNVTPGDWVKRGSAGVRHALANY